jgi:sodium-dependent dicarboxylate transporter 2/3/5
MAIYWTTEAIPLPATALLPVVLFPLFGIMDTGKVCTSYMKETNVLAYNHQKLFLIQQGV